MDEDDWDESEVVAVAPLLSAPPEISTKLEELRRAANGFRSATASAQGFVSGKRVDTLRLERRRYERALWEARDEIDALLKGLG